ncbi:Homeodomain-like protein [Stachybotrys elegans]|uniref:Homeodomain-like protein n=1 Tax=Stachybotrys elegans TaxID=80388 RepID=A0A8K0WUH1_9HYPO|nr:Homeodomain-like protein [Stachybotrys elegans]
MDTAERRIRRRWTEAEDNILYHEARTQLCGSLKKGAWDESEDERLREAVRIHGQRWATIANVVGLRSPDQCAKRWQYSLDPRLDHGEWTPEEDRFLLSLVRAHGRDWKLIHDQEFPRRAKNELKNRYSTLTRRPGTAGGENRSSCSPPPPPARKKRDEAPTETEAETNSDAPNEYDDTPTRQVLQWPSGTSDATAAQFALFPLDRPAATDWSSSDATTLVVKASPSAGQDFSGDGANGAESLDTQAGSSVRRISLMVDQCDPDTLEDLLTCVKKLKGNVKLEINV